MNRPRYIHHTRALAALRGAALALLHAPLVGFAPATATAQSAAPAPLATSAPLSMIAPVTAVEQSAASASSAQRAAERGARRSQLAGAESASEFWDATARFESGHRLFVRFQISNEGPGERTAIASWQLIDAAGKRTDFRNGRRESRWTLSEGGARVEIGSSLFDQSGAVHRLAYDSTKRGIRVEVEYEPRGPVAWAKSESPGEYPIDLLELATPARARIWLAGMPEPASSEGTIALTHTYLGAHETELALRRIDFASTDAGGAAIFLSDRTAPSGSRERWLVVARAGEVLHQSADFELSIAADPSVKGGDYPTIDELRIHGARVEGAILRGATLAELNPLDDIPQPFRFLLSLRTRPYRAWSSASFEIRLRPEPPKKLSEADESETVVKGSGITSVTYTNPLPPKTTSGPETATPGA